jgi:polyhydroxyalkanoate synthesis repressor PhaR
MARKPAPPSADAESTASKPQRVIKKYPNRRLYDTATSSYVTLSEIKQLVMQGETFVVRDAKSGEDLTRSLLLQIILEEESSGAPMFTEAVLANIIRFYGHAMQGHMGAYLESNLQSLMLMQSKMGHQSQNIMSQMQEQMQ